MQVAKTIEINIKVPVLLKLSTWNNILGSFCKGPQLTQALLMQRWTAYSPRLQECHISAGGAGMQPSFWKQGRLGVESHGRQSDYLGGHSHGLCRKKVNLPKVAKVKQHE